MAPSLRIGVDVGGTNTDAILLDLSASASPDRGVLGWTKSLTTPNPSDGIRQVIEELLLTSKIDPKEVGAVTIGTTHFINAVVELDAQRLAKVGVIRLCGPYSRSTPALVDWPQGLKDLISGHFACVDGGLEIDASLIKNIRPEEIHEQCDILISKGIKCIVVNGVFSTLDRQYHQEEAAAEIIRARIPDAYVVLSKDVANLGFIERENASILNASILPFAERTINSFQIAVRRLKLTCPVFLTQNDGTVLLAQQAVKLPIRTFCSGPTNSMRGAAFLVAPQRKDDLGQVIVMDIGGTTTDVGLLLENGFPRLSSRYTEIAGVRLNFSCPDVKSIGLGGGSIVRVSTPGQRLTIGPDSVGLNIQTRSTVFGGDVTTATDYTVAGSEEPLNIGNPRLVDKLISDVPSVRAEIKLKLERIIDTMKTSPDELTVLLVGGGAIIAPDALKGAKQVIKPQYSSVANAIGAAISRISGTIDIIVSTASKSTETLLAEVSDLAIAEAVKNGALRASITIAEAEELPLPYIANKSRFLVKAIGDFDFSLSLVEPHIDTNQVEKDEQEVQAKTVVVDRQNSTQTNAANEMEAGFNFSTYRPVITGKEWILSETDLKWISCGCYILGTGGGGTPYPHFLRLREMLRGGAILKVMRPEDLKDDDLVASGGASGSPTVSMEKLPGDEMLESQQILYKHLKVKPHAILPIEIGGGNGLQGLILGASTEMDIPCVDGDWMGRAYPTSWQISPAVYVSEAQFLPRALADGNGNSFLILEGTSERKLEEIVRAALTAMGSLIALASGPYPGSKTKKYIVQNTMSLSWRIGRAVFKARHFNTIATVGESIIKEVGGEGSAKVIFKGKIVGVERRLFHGHIYGEVIIEAGDISGQNKEPEVTGKLKIPYKNENIFALHHEGSTEKYIASVPDLITVLDAQTGEAIGTPEYRYGLLVIVIVLPATPHFTNTTKGLEIGGPKAFGFDNIEYKPIGRFSKPKSVINEFGSFDH